MLLFRSSLSGGGGGTESGKFNKIDGHIGIGGNIVLTEMVIDEET